jgi:aminoglycoside phosphotransferase (APT) family kinase protein
MAKRGEAAGTLDPAVGGAMASLADRLSGWLDRLRTWGAEETLLHGDCKPSQFLIDGAGVGILDFDHCGMGDPAADIGFFMASLRQRSSGTLESRAAREGIHPAWDEGILALERCFLDQYCEAAHGDGGFRHRAAWYQALALLRKAQRSFARSTRSVAPTALMREAHRCLATLPEPSLR